MIAGVSITTLLLVLVAGIGAGFVGYAVGASSLISYPALLAFGIPPVLSNTTNTVGVCGTGIGGLLSARKELKGQDCVLIISIDSKFNIIKIIHYIFINYILKLQVFIIRFIIKNILHIIRCSIFQFNIINMK